MTMNIAVMLKLRTIVGNHYALLYFFKSHSITNTKVTICMISHVVFHHMYKNLHILLLVHSDSDISC